MFDTIILGGGPAGVGAGIYAARKKMKSLLITQEFGGQSVVSDDIQNWIGEKSIAGIELAKKLEEHLRDQEGIQINMPEKILEVKENPDSLIVTTKKDEYQTKTAIVTIGARRRKLNIPGEKEFDGKGVVYCSTCDAPLFRDKTVAVIGGGNSGLEAVQDLIPYAKEIYLLHRSEKLSGDPITAEKIQQSDKLKEVIYNAQTTKILGEQMVDGLVYKDKISGQEKTLKLQGVFVEIGSIPNSESVKDIVDLNQRGEIVVDHKTQATSHPLIWAAGDVTDDLYKQNNISAGDGVKAILAAYNYLLGRKKD